MFVYVHVYNIITFLKFDLMFLMPVSDLKNLQ